MLPRGVAGAGRIRSQSMKSARSIRVQTEDDSVIDVGEARSEYAGVSADLLRQEVSRRNEFGFRFGQ